MRRLARMLAGIAQDVVMNTVVNGRAFPRPLRAIAWAALGHRVSRRSSINPSCFVGGWSGLTIGAGSFLNYGCFFDLCAPTTVGRHVQVGYQVMFCTCTHHAGDAGRRAGESRPAPISVGDGCWIGARTTIMPGVTIGAGVVVAAGSVVTSDCEPNGLYAGVPAVRKRTLYSEGVV